MLRGSPEGRSEKSLPVEEDNHLAAPHAGGVLGLLIQAGGMGEQRRKRILSTNVTNADSALCGNSALQRAAIGASPPGGCRYRAGTQGVKSWDTYV